MSGYPSTLDFAEFIANEGLGTVEPDTLTNDLDLAIAMLDEKSGWYPVYCDTEGDDTTFSFNWRPNPQGLVVPPNKGILSLTSMTIGDAVYTTNLDYFLSTQNKGGSYSHIRLQRNPLAVNIVTVVTLVGKFGFTDDVNVVLRNGIYGYALSYGGVLDRIQGNSGSGAVTKEKQGPVEITYGNKTTNVMGHDVPTGLQQVYAAKFTQAVEWCKRRI